MLQSWNLSMTWSVFFWRKPIGFYPETDLILSRHPTMKCHLMSTSAAAGFEMSAIAAIKKITACMAGVCKSNHSNGSTRGPGRQKTTMCHHPWKLVGWLFFVGETRLICTKHRTSSLSQHWESIERVKTGAVWLWPSEGRPRWDPSILITSYNASKYVTIPFS